MRAIAALLHLFAAGYVLYVAIRDSDLNLFYVIAMMFFGITAIELLVQQIRQASTLLYKIVTVLNVAFIPFIVIGCLTIIGNIFNNNASPALVLIVVALLLVFSASSLAALKPNQVLAPGGALIIAVSAITLISAAIIAAPRWAGTVLLGRAQDGYAGLSAWLNRVALLQGVATTVLIIAWVALLSVGFMRKRRSRLREKPA